MQKKAFRTELKPTNSQIPVLQNFCNIRRECYNWMLDKYHREYERVSSIVESAFKRIGVFGDDTGIDTVLKCTFIGIGTPPSKQKHIDRSKQGEKKKRRKGDEMKEDHEWFARQLVDPDVIAERTKLIKALAPAWSEYLVALWQWRELSEEERKGVDTPRRPSTEYRLFELARGDMAIMHAKKLWRRASKEDSGLAWTTAIHSSAIDSACSDLARAYTRWKSYVAKPRAERQFLRKVGYPRIREESSKGSFRILIAGKGVDIGDSWVDVPKIGRIKLKERGYLPVGPNAQQVTISTHCGRWFIAAMGDFDPVQYTDGRLAAGIDVGIVHYAAVKPDGSPVEYIENPESLDAGLKRLKMLGRFSSRKHGTDGCRVTMPDGTEQVFPKRHMQVRHAKREGRQVVDVKNLKPSKRWEKIQKTIARCHYSVANKRRDFQHKQTATLIKRFGLIGVETINIQNMTARKDKNKKKTSRNLRRRIADAGWGGFEEKLAYKGAWHGTQIHKVPENFPSTTLCSRCGATTRVGSRDRICKCPQCGLEIDRDENAAINILMETQRACGPKTVQA